jgi:hypothetical protein
VRLRQAKYALALVFVCAAALAAAARAEPVLEFLYVEANEGDSSGGHAALRFGEEVFHFQYHAGRLLRLERDTWPHFRHVYGRLGNRRIHARRASAAPHTAGLLRDAFAARYFEEEAQARFLEALRSDRALLEALADPEAGSDTAAALLPVEGAGYFSPDGADVEPSLVALRQRLVERDGSGALAQRIADSAAAMRVLRPDAADPARLLRAEEAPLALGRTFSQRLGDELARLRALEIVAGAPVLAPGTFHAPGDEIFRLDAAELRALARQAERLEGRLLALIASAQPDAGRTLLVGLARFAALSRSLASGRLVFLDVLPPEAPGAREGRRVAQPAWAAALREEARADLSVARAALVGSEDPGEAELSALETAGNRLQALDPVELEAHGPRLASWTLLPARSAPLAAPPLPALSRDERGAGLARAAQEEVQFSERFHALHRYDLVTKNCVTELFRAVDAAFAAAGEDPVTASRVRLGGWVDASAFVRFIPFVADATVARVWTLETSRVLPSERETRVAAMKEREPGLLVDLRESNTLTSRAYRLHGGDSFFVFFTEGAALSRPLLGAVNLLAGAGQALAGLALAPFDGGESLSAGAAGALFSLPELLFVSLRKGTLDWVPAPLVREELPTGALARDGP